MENCSSKLKTRRRTRRSRFPHHPKRKTSGCIGRRVHQDLLPTKLNKINSSPGSRLRFASSYIASTQEALVISERLDKSGADLVSLSERIDTATAAGKMVFRMFSVLSEFETDLVAERTKSALGHLRNRGNGSAARFPTTIICRQMERVSSRIHLSKRAFDSCWRKELRDTVDARLPRP